MPRGLLLAGHAAARVVAVVSTNVEVVHAAAGLGVMVEGEGTRDGRVGAASGGEQVGYEGAGQQEGARDSLGADSDASGGRRGGGGGGGEGCVRADAQLLEALAPPSEAQRVETLAGLARAPTWLVAWSRTCAPLGAAWEDAWGEAVSGEHAEVAQVARAWGGAAGVSGEVATAWRGCERAVCWPLLAMWGARWRLRT